MICVTGARSRIQSRQMVCSLLHFAFVAKVEKFQLKLFIKITPNAFAESYIKMLRCSDSSFSPKSHDVTNIFSRVSEQCKPRWWARASVYVIITRLHPLIIRIITIDPSFFLHKIASMKNEVQTAYEDIRGLPFYGLPRNCSKRYSILTA